MFFLFFILANLFGDRLERPYACGECKAQFVHYSGWFKHRNLHTKNIHDCEYCDQAFPTATEIKDHTKENHQDKINNYQCDECAAKFSVHVLFLYHKERHKDENKRINEITSVERNLPTGWHFYSFIFFFRFTKI